MTTSADCHPRAKEIKDIVVSAIHSNLKLNRFGESTVPFDFKGNYEIYHEYSDSLLLDLESASKVAEQLGLSIAILYNCLVQDAALQGHKTVTDLFENNLRINLIIDMENFYTGRISFKFFFCSSP